MTILQSEEVGIVQNNAYFLRCKKKKEKYKQQKKNDKYHFLNSNIEYI